MVKMESELYVYIHIPFCFKKCPYCAFVSFEKQLKLLPAYVNALTKEIESTKGSGYVVKTIYFGGGTPNTLKIKDFETILNAIYKKFNLSIGEFTVELTPKPLKRDYLKDLKSLGVTRVSLGVQSFRDEKLKALGRIHSVEKNIKTIELAHDVGFENISIDLIYGISDSVETIKEELSLAVELPVKHISTYGLTIEKNTPFFELNKKRKLKVCNDEECFSLYETICENLEKKGFNQYEISNFAKNGFHSKHNLAYWTGKNYLGFGVSAASFVKNTRFKNTNNLQEYLKNPTNSKTVEETLNSEELAKEMFILGLRLKKGVNIQDFKNKYNFDILEKFGDKLRFFIDNGFMVFDGLSVSLNKAKAMFVSNAILCEFL